MSEFRNELLLIGVTYYERMLIFKHLNNCPIKEIANCEIDRVELGFMNEDLVSVWFYLNIANSRTLKGYLESVLDINSIENTRCEKDIIYVFNDNILYYWRDDKYLLGIGQVTNGLTYIYITENNYILPHIYNPELQNVPS